MNDIVLKIHYNSLPSWEFGNDKFETDKSSASIMQI